MEFWGEMEKFFGKLLKKGRWKIFSEIWPPVSEVLDPLVTTVMSNSVCPYLSYHVSGFMAQNQMIGQFMYSCFHVTFIRTLNLVHFKVFRFRFRMCQLL